MRHINQIVTARLTEAHLQALLLRQPLQTETRAPAIAPGRSADDLIHLHRQRRFLAQHAAQRPRFALLLQRHGHVLLLAAAAHAEMDAARLLALRARLCNLFGFAARKLTLIFGQDHLGLFAGQRAADKQRFTVMARHALTKGIELVNGDAETLFRRHALFCGVKLRHSIVNSQFSLGVQPYAVFAQG